MGTVLVARPIPTPTIRRPITKKFNDGAAAQTMAPAMKIAAVTRSMARRPKMSASRPPLRAAMAAPTSTTLTTSSCWNVVSANCVRMKIKAPEMTPVS